MFLALRNKFLLRHSSAVVRLLHAIAHHLVLSPGDMFPGSRVAIGGGVFPANGPESPPPQKVRKDIQSISRDWVGCDVFFLVFFLMGVGGKENLWLEVIKK